MINEITAKYVVELSEKDCDDGLAKTEIERPTGATLIDVCRVKSLRKHLVLMSMANYIITLAFYVCLFSLNHLSGNRHGNFIISSCVDVIAYSVMFLALKRFGTRNTETALLFIMCALIGLVCLVSVLVAESDALKSKHKT